MSRYHVMQNLINVMGSEFINDECKKAMQQAIEDVNAMDNLDYEFNNIENPYDIYNNNQGYHGFEKGKQAILKVLKGECNEKK